MSKGNGLNLSPNRWHDHLTFKLSTLYCWDVVFLHLIVSITARICVELRASSSIFYSRFLPDLYKSYASPGYGKTHLPAIIKIQTLVTNVLSSCSDLCGLGVPFAFLYVMEHMLIHMYMVVFSLDINQTMKISWFCL